MVAQLVSDLKSAFSEPRIEAYRELGASDLDMVVNYFWNIVLAEAVVPCLHAFEICLRSSIHNAVSVANGSNELWYFTPGILEPNQLKDVATAYGRVYKKGQPVTDRLVASLMFGFWSSLLNAPYEQVIWSPNSFATLYAAFPNAYNTKGSLITRDEIQQRLQLINEFRNRVFHHEKIYRWNYTRGNPKAPIARTACAYCG